MYSLTLFSLALLAGQATASVLTLDIPAVFDKVLQTRQTSGVDPSQIPAQCQSTCTAPLNTLNGCADFTCLCSTTLNTQLHDCLQCVLFVGGAPTPSEVQQAQSALSQLEDTCNQNGHPVPTLTLSGGSGAGPTAGAGGSLSFPAASGAGSPSVGFSSPAATATGGFPLTSSGGGVSSRVVVTQAPAATAGSGSNPLNPSASALGGGKASGALTSFATASSAVLAGLVGSVVFALQL